MTACQLIQTDNSIITRREDVSQVRGVFVVLTPLLAMMG